MSKKPNDQNPNHTEPSQAMRRGLTKYGEAGCSRGLRKAVVNG